MKTGYRGTFVITWAQTETDGLVNAPRATLDVGSGWRWTGNALRVDGPGDVLLLENASGDADIHRRAANTVRRLLGEGRRAPRRPGLIQPQDPQLKMGFRVTDGRRSYRIALIEQPQTAPALLMFMDDVPPADTDLWVVQAALDDPAVNLSTDLATGVICFTPGTRIKTPNGERLVEDLGEGDRIQTKDNGAQEILWIGHRRISGARLQALPELRPVRLRAGALDIGRPDGDLIVSPQHRVLLCGRRAQALFNTDQVLVAAEDLIDDHRVHRDHTLRDVTYYHLLLPRHEILWANGVQTESFHPADMRLSDVQPGQRDRLFQAVPGLADDPFAYGDHVRRNLTRPEAAILRGLAA